MGSYITLSGEGVRGLTLLTLNSIAYILNNPLPDKGYGIKHYGPCSPTDLQAIRTLLATYDHAARNNCRNNCTKLHK